MSALHVQIVINQINEWLGNSDGLMIEDVVEWRDKLVAALAAAPPPVPEPPDQGIPDHICGICYHPFDQCSHCQAAAPPPVPPGELVRLRAMRAALCADELSAALAAAELAEDRAAHRNAVMAAAPPPVPEPPAERMSSFCLFGDPTVTRHSLCDGWWRHGGKVDRCVCRCHHPPVPAAPPTAHRFDCPDCGPGIAVDEDGCCRTCGADAKPVAAAPPPAYSREEFERDRMGETGDGLRLKFAEQPVETTAGVRLDGDAELISPARQSDYWTDGDCVGHCPCPTCGCPAHWSYPHLMHACADPACGVLFTVHARRDARPTRDLPKDVRLMPSMPRSLHR